MKRDERNEYNYIKRFGNHFDLAHGNTKTLRETTLTIRTNGSPEYKHALDELYASWGFYPTSIRIDTRMYDENERIIYVYGRTWTDYAGNEHSWTELLSYGEREYFKSALD